MVLLHAFKIKSGGQRVIAGGNHGYIICPGKCRRCKLGCVAGPLTACIHPICSSDHKLRYECLVRPDHFTRSRKRPGKRYKSSGDIARTALRTSTLQGNSTVQSLHCTLVLWISVEKKTGCGYLFAHAQANTREVFLWRSALYRNSLF